MKKILGLLALVIIESCTSTNLIKKQDFNNGKSLLNTFKIYAYSGPPLQELNLEKVMEIKNAGIDVLVPGNGIYKLGDNLKIMDLAQQVGLKIVPVDDRISPFSITGGIQTNSEVINKIIEDYKDHPAMAGYLIKDEPNARLFPDLKTACSIFRKTDPKHEPQINLFPSYGSLNQLGFSDYQTYIHDYIEKVNPSFVSYDFYALQSRTTLYKEWYNDLKIIREETRKAGIPFMVFIQSQGIKDYLRVPNRAEILWQVNTAIAYGARGIGWFSYWTLEPDQGIVQEEKKAHVLIEPHMNAMISRDGHRTEVYDYVREANLYLQKAGRELIGWASTHVAQYESGKLLEGGGASPLVTPKGIEANLIIGTYTKKGKARLVISNSSCEKPANFLLHLSQEWQFDKVFTSMDAKQKSDKNFMEWMLAPGGSVIIDLKRSEK